MPIYEYLCRECSHEFEDLVSMSQRDHATTCPACGGKGVQRKVSVFSAQQDTRREAGPPPSCNQCEHLGRCPGAGF